MSEQNDVLLAPAPAPSGACAVRTERPILFSPAMVRAILEGRKTQTRRVVNPKPQWGNWPHQMGDDTWVCAMAGDRRRCPYGVPGDRLWVREGWRPTVAHSHGMNTCDCGDVNVHYYADASDVFFEDGKIPNEWTIPKAADKGQVTALFMPRWASRITLEITEVRVQRVREITDEDAAAEGCVCDEDWTPRMRFAELWNSINEERGYSWQSNPWVWCISFRRVPQQGQARCLGDQRA